MISMCSVSWNDSTHIMGQWSEYDEIVHLGGKEMERERESEREEKRERRVEQEVSEVTRGREGKEKYSQRYIIRVQFYLQRKFACASVRSKVFVSNYIFT